MSRDGITYVDLDFFEYIQGTEALTEHADHVYWRLILTAYARQLEGMIPVETEGKMRALMRSCKKADFAVFTAALEELIDFGKVERRVDGLFIPSVARRLRAAREAKDAARARTAAGRAALAAERAAERAARAAADAARPVTEGTATATTAAVSVTDAESAKEGRKEVKGRNGRKEERKDSPALLDQEADAWSVFQRAAAAHGWPVPSKLTETRRAKLARAVRELGGVAGWSAALDRAAASAFLSGRRGSFVMTLDWMIEGDNLVKLGEGNYDDPPPGGGRGGGSPAMRHLKGE